MLLLLGTLLTGGTAAGLGLHFGDEVPTSGIPDRVVDAYIKQNEGLLEIIRDQFHGGPAVQEEHAVVAGSSDDMFAGPARHETESRPQEEDPSALFSPGVEESDAASPADDQEGQTGRGMKKSNSSSQANSAAQSDPTFGRDPDGCTMCYIDEKDRELCLSGLVSYIDRRNGVERACADDQITGPAGS